MTTRDDAKTIAQLETWGFAKIDDKPPTYRREADRRHVVICWDGRLATYQAGGSSRTIDLATFERDHARTPEPMPRATSWYRERKVVGPASCPTCKGWGVTADTLVRSPGPRDTPCEDCRGSGLDPLAGLDAEGLAAFERARVVLGLGD